MRFFVFALMAIAAVSAVQAEKEEKCEPGEIRIEFCNKCVCMADGRSKLCTKNVCPPDVYNKNGSLKNPNLSLNDLLPREKRESKNSIGEKCEPGVLFHKFCNTCICTSDGVNATCTTKECPEGKYNEDGSQKPGIKICEPWSNFKLDCNKCWCGGTGTLAMCTENPCGDTACEIGKVVRKGCDECTCMGNGNQSVCITKFCRDGLDPQNEKD